MTNKRSETGNAVIFILLAIALFAALAYTFTRSVQNGTGQASKHQSKMAASEIMNYANSIFRRVDKLRQNGCSENEISFENSTVTDYINPTTPSDGSCQVFSSGTIPFTLMSPNFYAPGYSSISNYNAPIFVGDAITKADSKLPKQNDLFLIIPYISREICLDINKSLGIDTQTSGAPPKEDSFYITFIAPAHHFTGDYGTLVYADTDGNGGTPVKPLVDKTSGCSTFTDETTYFFFMVLIDR